MATKKIKKIFTVPNPHMVGDGFRVRNYLPGPHQLAQEVSPFILLDYNAPFHFPPSANKKGVGTHPHRGFETVTIVYDGMLEHRDSSGGGGTIGPGDVQWMTAASGVLHDEFQTQEISEKGGIQHMIQLWVNLPSKYKMSPPKYQSLTDNNIGKYKIDESGSFARVIAGDLNGIKGPASTFTPIEMYDVRLKAGGEVIINLPAAYNTMLLVTKGSVLLNNEKRTEFQDFVLFEREGDEIQIKGTEDSFIFVLAGEPINEPVVSYGPFVMNTRREIMEAIEDYNSGKFGSI